MVVKIKNIAFHLICIGIFIIPSLIRKSVFETEWAVLNIVSWLGVILLIHRFFLNGKLIVRKGKEGLGNPLWLVLLIGTFVIWSLATPTFSDVSMVKYIYATLMPCIILYVTLPDEEILLCFECFCKYLTVACTFVVLCGVLDFIVGTGIGEAIAKASKVESLDQLIEEGRMVSYLGHSLLTAEVMLLCFLFNTLNMFFLKKKKSLWFTVYFSLLSLIGIGLSGSKTGIVLLIVAFALLYVNKRGFKYLLLLLAAVYFVYSMGLLEPVIERFLLGIEKGDLSTGRNTSLKLLLQSGILDFKFFTGRAGNIMSDSMIAALEYPPLRWAYMFGIWFSVVICVMLFVVPFIKCIKLGNKQVLYVLLILIADVNSYNGLVTVSDHMLLYCVSVFLLINFARIFSKNAKKKGKFDE